jgi:hypothetical protein
VASSEVERGLPAVEGLFRGQQSRGRAGLVINKLSHSRATSSLRNRGLPVRWREQWSLVVTFLQGNLAHKNPLPPPKTVVGP